MLEQEPGDRVPPTQRVGVEPASVSAAAGIDLEWVDAQLSRFDLLLRTLVEPEALARLLLLELAPLVGAAQGAVYSTVYSTVDSPSDGAAPSALLLRASYAAGAGLPESVLPGEGLLGQCALAQRKLVVRDVRDEHFRVRSALGSSAPRELACIPVWLGESTLAVVELGFAGSLSATREALLDRLAERRPRAARTPPEQAAVVPDALRSARSCPSRRSGFWGKLSHELRSPLNSVLVLSQLLSENEEKTLTAKQVAFAKAIHASGNELLALVNAISDLTKIETNRLVLEPTEMSFEHFKAHLERAFDPIAKDRGLEFDVELAPGLPPTLMTDARRLRQIMKCLLSNAFKFTESGRVSVNVSMAGAGWSSERERLNNAREVVAFSVSDTGVGMSEGEQRSILEVFPPEHIESRRGLGASGLGLAISRELGRLLGGELRVSSVVGLGSTFTLYLPTCGLPSVSTEEADPDSVVSSVQPVDALLGQAARGEASALTSTPASVAGGARATSGRRDAEPGSRRLGPVRARGKRREAPDAPHGTELEGLNILLVEDDVRSAFALTGLLERQGAAVSHAEDVSEAAERLAEGCAASALLIDAELLTSGSEGPRERMLERCGRVPIVALTSLSHAPRAGAASLPAQVSQLAKPVDLAELVSLLRRIARAKSLES